LTLFGTSLTMITAVFFFFFNITKNIFSWDIYYLENQEMKSTRIWRAFSSPLTPTSMVTPLAPQRLSVSIVSDPFHSWGDLHYYLNVEASMGVLLGNVSAEPQGCVSSCLMGDPWVKLTCPGRTMAAIQPPPHPSCSLSWTDTIVLPSGCCNFTRKMSLKFLCSPPIANVSSVTYLILCLNICVVLNVGQLFLWERYKIFIIFCL
jgi:hypothetical protein